MLRVGLVGFGMAGRAFHGPLISSVEGLELAAVVERHGDQAAQRYPGLTTYRTLEDLWRYVDRPGCGGHAERDPL